MSGSNKWQVEYIGSQANILVSDSSKPTMDLDPIGMGFPIKLAENIVNKHNAAIETNDIEIKILREQRNRSMGDYTLSNLVIIERQRKEYDAEILTALTKETTL